MANTRRKLSAGQIVGGESSEDLNRAWSSTLLFDKKEITTVAKVMDGDITYTLATSGNLNSLCNQRHTLITDGTHAINFGYGFQYLTGITSGQVLAAGTYRLWFFFDGAKVDVTLHSGVPKVDVTKQDLINAIAPRGLYEADASAKLSGGSPASIGQGVRDWANENNVENLGESNEALQPILVDDSGIRALQFDGTKGLYRSYFNPTGLSEMCIYVVCKPITVTTPAVITSSLLRFNEAGSSGGVYLTVTQQAIRWRFASTPTDNTNSHIRATDPNYSLVGILKNGSEEFLQINGETEVSLTGRPSTISGVNSNLFIVPSGTNRWQGNIAAIMFLDYYPDTDQQALINSYFNGKYNLW